MGVQPWQVGTEDQRWAGYLDPAHFDPVVGQNVMRNLVRATSYDELRTREDAAVGMRTTTLHAHGIPSSYDVAGLREIHRHLFQDVYPWAGELRTVNLVKAWEPFAPPDRIEEIVEQVTAAIRDTDLLRRVPDDRYAGALGSVYSVLNVAHPFREGNGRTQREFIAALATESGHAVDWSQIQGHVNDVVSHAARRGDHVPMTAMFEQIVTRTGPALSPGSRLPRAVSASYPAPATGATHAAPSAPSRRPYRSPGAGQGQGPSLSP